ncbi:acetate--CoA ligase family protein [Pseudofrankia asymbiotica]|uniref:CoA-binding domain-containing protein n=1 Tax=Pseudofrankia asymbiotica TaxID=1834516 RepID=A0A1V2I0M8_9ACTN|nr:acetate--CoA ligase family protein [Pseudofrankia asymbiotica]ONH22888.1 hypothetical protein BL253_34495 [Pseudofrankia asymbiotica]
MTTAAASRRDLDALLRPKSVAFVGASDKSTFSTIAYDLQRRFGAADRTFLINPNKPVVHGQATYPSVADVPGGVDCAFVMVPQRAVLESIEQAAAAGARAAVVLSAGYAETGPEGAKRQAELVAVCERNDLVLLGPNHLGFANMVDGLAVCSLPGLTPRPGPLAVVSQSGALAGTMSLFAADHGIEFSFVVTTGNEAMVTAEDVLAYLVEDETTRAVAVFAEAIRRPDVFLGAVRRARALGKAVVMLKAGSSELSARTAVAHTGALVGDDAVVDAVLRQEGVIRVGHLEELLLTGHLAARTGPWTAPGVAVVSISGGACDIVADQGEKLGLPLPSLAPETEARLGTVVSELGHAQNPLDVTGAALMDHALMGRVVSILAEDPQVGMVLAVGVPDPSLPRVRAALDAASVPGAVAATIEQALTGPRGRATLDAGMSGLTYLPSTRDAVHATAAVSRWSAWYATARADAPAPAAPPRPAVRPGVPLSEHGVRTLLAVAGVPVVPGVLATSADQAADAFDGPVALKIVSPDVQHKTDIGGVRLGVAGPDAIRAAYAQVLASVDVLDPRPAVEGVLVTPMRSGGLELLVGVVRDDQWGPILAIGLGGVFVEVLRDTALLRLPATAREIAEALASLRAAPLLRGARGVPPADLDRLVEVILAIGGLALSLGDDLAELEVNPLHVHGSTIEALDGLLTWRGR